MGSPDGMGLWLRCIWRVARTLEGGHKGSGGPRGARKKEGAELGLGGEDAEHPRGDGWNVANGEGFTEERVAPR